MSARGGATVTMKGAALHAGGMNEEPVFWWIPMVSEVCRLTVVGLYQPVGNWCGDGCEQLLPHTTSVDLNKLPEDMEATRSVGSRF